VVVVVGGGERRQAVVVVGAVSGGGGMGMVAWIIEGTTVVVAEAVARVHNAMTRSHERGDIKKQLLSKVVCGWATACQTQHNSRHLAARACLLHRPRRCSP
jgi:hypothetical protein